MAVKTFVQPADSDTITTKKIEVLSDSEFRVKYDENGTERVIHFDLSGYFDDGKPLYGEDIGFSRVIQQYETYPSVVFNIFGQDDVSPAELDISSYPHYLYTADGETETAETTVDSYAVSMKDAEKLAVFKTAYREWEQQVEAWLREAVGFIGLSFDILRRGGIVMKAASYTLHQMALDATIDKGDLAKVVRLMTQGATDVRNAKEFAVYLNGLGQYFPDGPVKPRNASGIPTPGETHVPVGVLWVSDASGSWERVASDSVVFYDDYEVPADYNPNDLGWLDDL